MTRALNLLKKYLAPMGFASVLSRNHLQIRVHDLTPDMTAVHYGAKTSVEILHMTRTLWLDFLSVAFIDESSCVHVLDFFIAALLCEGEEFLVEVGAPK